MDTSSFRFVLHVSPLDPDHLGNIWGEAHIKGLLVFT